MGDEEDEEIERRREFVHIPDLSEEKAVRAKALRTVRDDLHRLRDEGHLLLEQSPSPLDPQADPATNGFISAAPSIAEPPIYRISPPFETGPIPLGITAAIGRGGVVVSSTGRLLAVVRYQEVDVWDRNSGERVVTLASEPPVRNVLFLPDDKGLIVASKRLDVYSLPDGKLGRRIDVGANSAMALHPAGSLLVVVSRLATVQVVDLDAGQVVSTFLLDRRQDPGSVDKLLAGPLASVLRNQAGLSSALHSGLFGEAFLAEQPRAFLFSADGRYLICGTNQSAQVFRWRTLLAVGVEAPPPLYRFHLQSKTPGLPMAFLAPAGFSATVGSLAYDAGTNCALLGCGDGVIRSMDLESGEVGTLLTVPGGNMIRHMVLSSDASYLCTVDVSMHDLEDRIQALRGGRMPVSAMLNDGPRDRMMIWDYAKLRGKSRA